MGENGGVVLSEIVIYKWPQEMGTVLITPGAAHAAIPAEANNWAVQATFPAISCSIEGSTANDIGKFLDT